MSEFDGEDWLPRHLNSIRKVCAQCKHFYVRIDDVDDHAEEVGMRMLGKDGMRVCYEVHWCNAASPVCDDDFEPLTTGRDIILGMFNDFKEEVESKDLSLEKPVNFDHFGHREELKHQKEIQYVYIGLLQQLSDGELVEVPTEIDGVATNYRRVETGPLDWDLSWISPDGTEIHQTDRNLPLNQKFNTATNSVDIDFPVAQTEWSSLTHFGLYDLPVGGKLICTSEFMVCMDILAGNCAAITTGVAEIPLEHLTNNNKRKKGGE